MAHDSRVAIAIRELYGLNCFGKCADLVNFDENTVRDALFNPLTEATYVRYEQVVANQLQLR